MRWLIRIFSIIFVILLILAALAFMNANAQPHELRFLDWQLAQAEVGVWVLVALGFGAVLGFLASVPLILNLSRQKKRMQKKLSEKAALQSAAS